jgi:hypothetical protein
LCSFHSLFDEFTDILLPKKDTAFSQKFFAISCGSRPLGFKCAESGMCRKPAQGVVLLKESSQYWPFHFRLRFLSAAPIENTE